MRLRPAATIFMMSLLLVGVLLCFALSQKGPLERPVLEGKPIGHWLELMGSDGGNRVAIRDRLVTLGPAAIPPLLAALEDRPSAMRVKVSSQIWGLVANHHPSAVPSVQRLLWPRRPSSRWMAAYTLAAMPPDPTIRDGLIRSLRLARDPREDSSIGFYAARGLAEHHTNDPTAVIPALRAALQVPHDNIQAQAALALPGFGTNGLVAVPELIKLVSGTNDYLSSHVAKALGQFGPAAVSALPAIRPLLTNKEPAVRRTAAVAIWKIAPETGFPADVLLFNMRTGRPQERVAAAQELRTFDPTRTREVIATLVDVIKSQPEVQQGQANHGPRWHAAQLLGEMGAEAKEALPILAEAESDQGHEWVREAAKEARQKIEAALAGTAEIAR